MTVKSWMDLRLGCPLPFKRLKKSRILRSIQTDNKVVTATVGSWNLLLLGSTQNVCGKNS